MRRALFAFVALAACTGRERSTQPTVATDPSQLLARVRGSDPSFTRFGRAFEPSNAAVQIAMPTHSRGEARIALDPARALSVRALDLAPSAVARRVDEASLFAAVAPSTDLLFAREGDRFEEVRVLHDERAPASARWAISPSDGIASLRIDHGAVEALDHNGRVALRSDRIFAVDAKGVRREPALTLHAEGSTWILEATLDRAGLAYPIVLDPVWLPGGSMSVTRNGAAAVRMADGKVYVGCGGSGTFEVFDPSTSSFKTLSAPTTFVFNCSMFPTSDGKIRVAGNGTVLTYTPSTDTWTKGTDGTPTSNARVVALADGKLLFTGGIVDGGLGANTVTEYDPAADTWSTKANLTTGRSEHAAVLLKSGKVLVTGGTGDTGRLSSTEIYDPSTNTWTAGPATPVAASGRGWALLSTGKVFFAGGQIGGGVTNTTVIYDPTAGTMTAGPLLTVAREVVAVLQSKDGRAFTIGGGFSGEGASDAVEFTDTTTITATTKLLQPRSNAPAIELLDGRILVIGGNTGASYSTSSTELLSAFANGSACSWAGECASGFCASGVCCDKACTGECERCAVPGKEGTCTPAPNTTECGTSAACTGSKLTTRGRCSGTDTTCAAGASSDCAGGLICADTSSCLAKCSKNEDCTTLRCDTALGLCLPPAVDAGVPDTEPVDAPAAVAPVPEGSPKVLGSAQRCTSPSECATGFCVDGVCCDSECKDKCHSCALPSSPGRCTEEPLGVDLRSECGAALSCSGTCGKGGVCTTSVAGSQCQASTCTGPTTGKGAAVCVATGGPCGTEASVAFDCGAYACDPAFGACRTSCTASDACAPGYTCNLEKKNCERLPDTQDDSGCAVTDGRKSGTGAALLLLALVLRASRGFRRRGR